ncbi:ABC transporter ATP-binding protein [Roseococcus pinisoli]|uniref:ABC transporter ATP-binding protein n=1 Tax=Roseococcus pinisoli TaxID=2835040 RepID=A0ABS5QJM4_9PROT|nr:ABC transporter ATP-binding protein [Roseococcus pinisoli]
MAEVALEGKGLAFSAGGTPLVQGVSTALERGRVLGVIGPNGAGKSTLGKLLVGQLAPQAGEVMLMGRPLAAWPRRERAALIGHLPQHFEPHWDYRVDELLRLGLDRAGRGAPTLEVLAGHFDLGALLKRHWSTLSGGERARALTAAVLAPDPPVVLADEPAAALDVGQAAALMARLRKLADGGAAVAVVVHDLNLAARWCDRLLLMEAGRAVTEAGPAEVLNSPELDRVFATRFQRVALPEGGMVLAPAG